MLQSLLEQVGAHQQVEGACAVHRLGLSLDALLNPAPALGVGDVHEFDAHAAAINAPCLARKIAVNLKVGMRLRRQKPERIQFRLKVAKLPEKPENALALIVVDDFRGRSFCTARRIVSRNSHKRCL